MTMTLQFHDNVVHCNSNYSQKKMISSCYRTIVRCTV